MKIRKIIFVIFSQIFLLCAPFFARATTLMIPANTSTIDETYSDCAFTYNYVVSNASDCWVYLSIPGLVGETLTSITFYYYDNSGSQYFYGYVKRQTIDSTSSATTLGSMSDTSTSSSVQDYKITLSSVITDDYSYFVYVKLKSGTEFSGIKVEY